jgi:RND superfamily putative drug exporter
VAGSGAGGSQFRDIAFGLALGILMDTFLVRTLLVPSAVILLGRWNWWPAAMSRAAAAAPRVPVPAAAADAARG